MSDKWYFKLQDYNLILQHILEKKYKSRYFVKKRLSKYKKKQIY